MWSGDGDASVFWSHLWKRHRIYSSAVAHMTHTGSVDLALRKMYLHRSHTHQLYPKGFQLVTSALCPPSRLGRSIDETNDVTRWSRSVCPDAELAENGFHISWSREPKRHHRPKWVALWRSPLRQNWQPHGSVRIPHSNTDAMTYASNFQILLNPSSKILQNVHTENKK